MESVRRYVFPVIWMAVLALIAISLAKLAFFPSGASAGQGQEDPAGPTANVDMYATLPVEKGDIDSTLTLPATVRPDASAPLLADHEGEINKIWVKSGDIVAEGDRILQVRMPEATGETDTTSASTGGDESTSGDEPTGGDGASSAGQSRPRTPPSAETYRYFTLTAGRSGTIRDLSLVEGQSIAPGDTVAQLSPGTYAIVADITPEQQLQMLDGKIRASAALPTSKNPVACKSPRIEEQSAEDAPSADQQSSETDVDPMTGMPVDSGESSAAQLRCPVPEGSTIVPGLSVDVTVDLGTAEDVLTVPLTAVEGDGENGAVYAMDEKTGEPTKIDVTVGLRGADSVEITDGLEDGQEILQFVPGVENPDDTEEDAW